MKTKHWISLISLFVSLQIFSQNICFKSIEDYSFIQNYNSGFINGVFHSTAHDFNNDGFKDVVLGHGGSSLLYYSGTGTGTFAPCMVLQNASFTVNARGVLSGFYNGDGNADIVVVGGSTSNTKIQFLFGTGTGSFTYSPVYTSTISINTGAFNSVTQGDLNNDGLTDFLIGYKQGSTPTMISAITNSAGAVTFGQPVAGYTTTASPELLDYNGDNISDIVANGSSAFLGLGNGAFSQSPTPLYFNSSAGSYNLTDINGDGKKDLIYEDPWGGNNLLFRYKLASGFSAAYTINSNHSINGIQAADINGDGLNEIIGIADSINSVIILKNNGFNTFQKAASIPIDKNVIMFEARQFFISDLNNDGKKDIIIGGHNIDRFFAILGNSSFQFSTGNVVKYKNVLMKGFVAAGDFNNDGRNDFATSFGNIYNHQAQALGGYSVNISGPFGGTTGKLYKVDFNNDGFPDLINLVNSSSNSNQYLVYPGNGTGQFATPVTVVNNPTFMVTASDMAFADFDNDNFVDIVTANSSVSGYSIIKGGANFTFSTTAISTFPGAASDVVTADFNNDGQSDFSIVHGTVLDVLLGNGNATFQTPQSFSLASSCCLIQAGNFNNDNFKDLVVVNGNSGGNKLHVLLGNGTGSFTLNQTFTLNLTVIDIKSSDLNGDGKDEIILNRNASLNNIWIGVSNNSGFFNFNSKYTVNTVPSQIDVADMNGDNTPDLVIADGGEYFTNILYNTTPISPPGGTYTICTGGSVLITVPSNYQIQWSNGGNTPSQVISSPGTYTVTSSNFIGSCTSSAIFQVISNTLSATPVNFVNTNTALCQSGIPIALSSSPSSTLFSGSAVAQGFFSPQQASTGTNVVYVTYINGNQCSSVNSLTFQVNPGPVVFAGNDSIICDKAVITLSATGTATSYAWNNGIFNGVAFVPPTLPVNGLKYTVAATNSLGCTSKDSLLLFPNVGCNTVWPGDADIDGNVSANDLMVVGLGFGLSQLPRAIVSNSWAPYDAIGNNLIPSTNYKVCYADCNGDAFVNMNDTLAINQNWGMTHLVKPLQEQSISSTNADLYIQFNSANYTPGTPLIADIYLGKSNSPISQLYGLSFYLEFDNTVFQATGITSFANSSWIGNNNQSKINLTKIDQPNGRIDFGICKITHNDTSGFGKIATVQMVLNQNVGVSNSIFTLKNVKKINSVGVYTTLTGATDTIQITTVTDIHNSLANDQSFRLLPNPVNDVINISCGTPITKVELINAFGQLVSSYQINESSFRLNLSHLQEGVYFVRTCNSSSNRTDKIILIR